MAAKTDTPSSTAAVRDAFAGGEHFTDAELVARVRESRPDLHRGQIIPARGRLARRGDVKLVGKDERGSQVWVLTPADEIDEAKAAEERRRTSDADKLLKNRKPEALAQVVAALLDHDDVNRLLREQTERARSMRRARARAQDAQAESEAERRQRKRDLAEAEKEKTKYLDFLKVHDALRDSISVLFDVRTFMRGEVARRQRGEEGRIPVERWADVQRNLHELIHVGGALWHDLTAIFDAPPEQCPLCGERIARDPRALDEGYIESDAEEDEEVVDALVVE
ncbi:MAG TPA: hypothetical protein VF533_03405 [Solirubrobacteraceae bacterium]|jgi:hypothetical protein